VRIAVPEAVSTGVGLAVPEAYVIAIPSKKRRRAIESILESARAADALLIGPGFTDVRLIEALLPELLSLTDLRGLVIDAFALPFAPKLLRKLGASSTPTILTPHYGEMALLTGKTPEEISSHPAKITSEAAAEFHSTIALKSAKTHIAAPASAVYLNTRGHPGLGTAGSGDVLAGLLTGLCARGADPLRATLWSTWLHGSAGLALGRRVGLTGYLAREIADELPHHLPRK